MEEAALVAKKSAVTAELKSLEKQKQVAEEQAKESRQRATDEVEALKRKKMQLEEEAARVVEQQKGE